MKNILFSAAVVFVLIAVSGAANCLYAENQVIGDIKIVGNDKTRTDVILTEMMMKSGDPYDELIRLEIQHRIMNLQYFMFVNVQAEPASGTNKVNLTITVKERQTWGIYPILTFSSNSKDEYGLEATENNLMGTGNALTASLRLQEDFQSISASFYDRHVKNSNFTFGAGGYKSTDNVVWLSTWENDVDIWSVYLQTGYWFTYELRGTLGFSTRDAEYTGVNTTVVPLFGVTNKIYLTLQYYNVDYTLYAYQGPTVYLTYQKGQENLDSQFSSVVDDYSFSKTFFGATYYWNTTKDHIFRISLNGGTGSDLPWYDLFSVGGNGSVRGYPGGAMGGEKYLQSTLEYRIPMIVNKQAMGMNYTLTVLGFADMGYAWMDTKDFGDAIMGAGVGARLYIHNWQTGTVALDIANGFDDDAGGDLNFYLSFGAIY